MHFILFFIAYYFFVVNIPHISHFILNDTIPVLSDIKYDFRIPLKIKLHKEKGGVLTPFEINSFTLFFCTFECHIHFMYTALWDSTSTVHTKEF